MDWNKIARLLDGYYDGSLTHAEEETLREALRSRDLPIEWSAERDQILGMDFLKTELRLSPNFDSEFSALLRPDMKEPRLSPMLWISGLAASVALFISLLIFQPSLRSHNHGNHVFSKKDIRATEQAINQTQLAFAILNSELEAGKRPLQFLKALRKPEELNHLKTLDQIRVDLESPKQ